MQIKPAQEEKHKWLHKLAIEPANGRASISTSKLKLWEFLRVQIVAHYDSESRSPGVQWRCAVLCSLISVKAHPFLTLDSMVYHCAGSPQSGAEARAS